MTRTPHERERDVGRPPVPGERSPAGRPSPSPVSNRAVVDLLGGALRSSGEPLPPGLSAPLGKALGASLAAVRVHRGDPSARAAAALHARAFTVGQDVHFGSGRYDPGAPAGQRLLGHEVAHTVQQRSAQQVTDSAHLEVSRPADPAEVEADAFARRGPAGSTPVAGRVARAVVHRNGNETPDDVVHEPLHAREAIAIWDSTFPSIVRTTTMVGALRNAILAAMDIAVPQVGHYGSEEGAIAAIRSAGGPGAVFVEEGRYVAYHAEDSSLVYGFTYDNLRWVEGKPWTSLRFIRPAVAIVTEDGVTVGQTRRTAGGLGGGASVPRVSPQSLLRRTPTPIPRHSGGLLSGSTGRRPADRRAGGGVRGASGRGAVSGSARRQ